MDVSVPIAMPKILIPIVLITVCGNSLSVNALIKFSKPTNSLSHTGSAKDPGFTSWNAIVQPHRGTYLKIISQMTNGTDIRRRYLCLHIRFQENFSLASFFFFIRLSTSFSVNNYTKSDCISNTTLIACFLL